MKKTKKHDKIAVKRWAINEKALKFPKVGWFWSALKQFFSFFLTS